MDIQLTNLRVFSLSSVIPRLMKDGPGYIEVYLVTSDDKHIGFVRVPYTEDAITTAQLLSLSNLTLTLSDGNTTS